jgi:hypothetical protein
VIRRPGTLKRYSLFVEDSTVYGVLGLASDTAWEAACDAVHASGHSEVGDQQIGEVLSRVPAGGDGAWPHEEMRELLEDLASDHIETGVYLGVGDERPWRYLPRPGHRR